MDTELIRKQYDFELEQRNSLASAVNIPIVAITVVTAAASAVLLDFGYSKQVKTYLFLGFLAIVLLAVSHSIYSVFRSFWNYEYKKLPGPFALSDFMQQLTAWHAEQGKTDADAHTDAEADFDEYLNQRLAEAVEWNGQNNLVRGNYLHRATAAIAVAVACLIPGALLYAYTKAIETGPVHHVRIVNLDEVGGEAAMSKTPASSPSAPSTAPATSPDQAPPPATTSPKPLGPPNTTFRSITELTKPSADVDAGKK